MDTIMEIMKQLSLEIREQAAEEGSTLPRIPWVPIPKPSTREERVKNQDGWLVNIQKRENSIFLSYAMLEVYFPPILAPKYHSVNISQLMKDPVERHCLGVAMWHVLRNQSFALRYLNTAHCKFTELENIERSNKASKIAELKNWSLDAKKLIQLVQISNNVPSGPLFKKDSATKASEFLFEPSVLIQLPWNSDLLHQWLVAALIEVLVFEKHSLELKYWPFEENIEKCATELVNLVKKLKERIMVGFCIFLKKVKYFPKMDQRFPAWILDEVVLPSLSTLQFLITGIAFKVIKSIKKLAWSECKQVESLVYMPVAAYEMDYYLEQIFAEFYYSASVWHAPQFDPLCVQNLDNERLENVITRISRNNPPQHPCQCKCVPGRGKRNSPLEDSILKLIIHDQKEKPSSVEEKIKITMICMNKLLQADKLSMGSWIHVNMSLNSPINKEDIENIFPDGISTDLQNMIKLSMMNEMTNAFLHDREKSCTVLSQVVNLGLEVLERAQLIRLMNIVYYCEDSSPFIPNADKFTVIDVESMLKLIHGVSDKKKQMKRTWLWSQLPSEWRNPVIKNEEEILLSCALSDVVKKCEGRIGRIIYNTVQTCLASPGKEVFQDWQTVQYIMPCHIATWLETIGRMEDDKLKCKTNIMKVISGILTHYEKKFKLWREEKKSAPANNDDSAGIHEIIHSIQFYFEQISYIQATHFETAEGINSLMEIHEALQGYDKLICSLSYFPTLTATGSLKTPVFTQKWVKVGFSILKDLHDACVNSLHPIVPSEIQHCDKIGQYYYTDMNLRFLFALFKCCSSVIDDDVDIPHEMVVTLMQITELLPTKHWVTDLIFNVMDFEENERNDLPEGVVYEKKDMKTIYSKLKHVKSITKNLAILTTPTFFIENMPFNVPEFKMIAKFYLENNFENLDKMFPLLFNKKPKKPSASQLANLKTELQLNTSSELKHCENCKKRETKAGTFIVCIKCVSQGFANVNYYCGSNCQQAWWYKEHLAQHLEFELGLA